MQRTGKAILSVFLAFLIILLASCQNAATPTIDESKPTIIVTYSVLGAVVSDLVGDQANVIVAIPNGQDLHDWEPSARDIETLTHADLIVQNGLGLEGGLEKSLAQAREAGVEIFTASDYITVRTVGAGQGIPSGDPDQAEGAQDPHLWFNPINMKQIVAALADTLNKDLGLDVSSQAADLENRLDELDSTLAGKVSQIPENQRKLVTGHESLGYYADRYGFQLIGAIIPSLSTQSEVSASQLSTLNSLIEQYQVKAVFTELGTPAQVAESVGQETGAKVVQLATHTIPEDGSYFTFMTNLTDTIVNALK